VPSAGKTMQLKLAIANDGCIC